MNKYLLGTTALAAVAFAAAPATAAEPIKISITGYYSAGISYTSQDIDLFIGSPGEMQEVHVRQDGEIQFVGETTLDNGLVVGVQVELEAFTTDDQIDEHYVYFEGTFGHLRIGADDHVAEQMHSFVPTATPGGTDTPTYFLFATDILITPNTAGTSMTSDENKIIYFTPRFAGFQFGASYAPNGGSDRSPGGTGGQYGTLADEAFAQEESYSFAANYVQEFNSFGIDIGTSYQIETWNDFADDHVFGGHLYFTFGGFTVGASGKYVDIGGTRDSLQSYGLGGLYEMGAWAFSLGMVRTQYDNEDSPIGYDSFLADLGVSYTLGPGVAIWGFGQYFEEDTGGFGLDLVENEGFAMMFGSTLSF